MPQKPPRGMARGPPQLVLPPPPPYPPPDTDVAEPLGFPGEGAASEASNLRPTRTCLSFPYPYVLATHLSVPGVGAGFPDFPFLLGMFVPSTPAFPSKCSMQCVLLPVSAMQVPVKRDLTRSSRRLWLDFSQNNTAWVETVS